MSSNALSTVLFPDPDSPVRMTSCRPGFRGVREWRSERFTDFEDSTLDPALVGARDSHIFPVLCHGPARDVDAIFFQLLGNLFVGERLGGIFFVDHFLHQPL